MFRRGRFTGFFVGLVLVLGLAGLGGYVGYEQGYDAGVAEVIQEGTTTIVYAPDQGPFGSAFYGVGLFFKIIFFLLFFFIIMSVFKFFAFGMMGGHRGYAGRGWHGHPGGHHGGEHRWGRNYRHDDEDPEVNGDEVRV